MKDVIFVLNSNPTRLSFKRKSWSFNMVSELCLKEVENSVWFVRLSNSHVRGGVKSMIFIINQNPTRLSF